ncbi:hypothetical protein EJB05_35013, partial [Eragrostis curvula]
MAAAAGTRKRTRATAGAGRAAAGRKKSKRAAAGKKRNRAAAAGAGLLKKRAQAPVEWVEVPRESGAHERCSCWWCGTTSPSPSHRCAPAADPVPRPASSPEHMPKIPSPTRSASPDHAPSASAEYTPSGRAASPEYTPSTPWMAPASPYYTAEEEYTPSTPSSRAASPECTPSSPSEHAISTVEGIWGKPHTA